MGGGDAVADAGDGADAGHGADAVADVNKGVPLLVLMDLTKSANWFLVKNIVCNKTMFYI